MKLSKISPILYPSAISIPRSFWRIPLLGMLMLSPLQAAGVLLDQVSHSVSASSFASASGFPTVPPGPTVATPSFSGFDVTAASVASRTFALSQGATHSEIHASGAFTENGGTWLLESDVTSRSEAISTGATWSITTSIQTISSYYFTLDDSFDYTIGGSVILANSGGQSTTFDAGFEIFLFRTDVTSEIWTSGAFSETSLANVGFSDTSSGTLEAGSYEFRIITTGALGGSVAGGETASSNSQALYSLELSAIPEASSLLLAAAGILPLALKRKRPIT